MRRSKWRRAAESRAKGFRAYTRAGRCTAYWRSHTSWTISAGRRVVSSRELAGGTVGAGVDGKGTHSSRELAGSASDTTSKWDGASIIPSSSTWSILRGGDVREAQEQETAERAAGEHGRGV